ncbi:LANO_0G15764g1_1 [Lachancea nothofagi CBS 11611]|uniref:LANO_0G15764g1_1 n=1 Tax=Lachancea nothofagi CBS 11611 TaxID=1266666 RepID=A0A1G4KKH2_9SACH|nr:LANO_0G15764g1_1 [Lachancea nothofagi CBS 11611]
MDHIPAWKRIAIKNREADTSDDATALNVTTHLATANLSKREKRKIIRGEPDGNKSKKVANPNKKQKKDKAPREERVLNKEQVLKDQLRYLIDFYREKVGKLPQEVWEHKPARAQLGGPDEESEEKDSDKAQVVEVWKFSKQKQNWLLKHILDDIQIPEVYDELVYAYFKDLKGGSRLALMKSCQECIDRDEKAKLETQPTPEVRAETNQEEDEEKKESVDETEEGQKAEIKKAPISEVPPSAHQVQRAKRLLQYLEQE